MASSEKRSDAATSRSGRAKAAAAAGAAKKATAAKAAARARRGRADHGQMSRHEKAMRDSAIIAAAHAGEGTGEIAKQWGITQRSVQRVIEEFSVMPSPLDSEPMQLLEELVRIYRRQITDFARVAAVQAEKNPSVSLGAMKAQADAIERYVSLLVDVGKIPDNLELFRSQAELQRLLRDVIQTMHRVAEGDLSAVEAVEVFDGLLRPAGVFDAPAGSVQEIESGEAA